MKKTVISPNRIADVRRAKGLTQQQLAELVGSHWITISKLERGKMQLTTRWITRLVEALGVTATDLLEEGVFEPRSVVLTMGLEYGRISSFPEEMPVKIAELSEPESIWAGVLDDSLKPFFSRKDVLRFFRLYPGIIRLAVGRLCIAITTDGESQLGTLDAVRFRDPDGKSLTEWASGAAAEVDFRQLNGMVQRAVPVQEVAVFTEAIAFWPLDR